MSCRDTSRLLLARTTPVTPPRVNKNRKPRVHRVTGLQKIGDPKILASQLKILIPVGTAIIIVALVK